MENLSLDKLLSIRKNLEHILDSFREGIIAHDLSRRIFFFNRAAEKITGYSRDDVLGRDCHEVFGNPLCGEKCLFCDDKPLMHEHMDYPIQIITKSGKFKRIDMSVTLMTDEDDRFVGVLASLTDVTDLLDLRIRAGKLTQFSNIIGKDKKMIQIFQQIIDVAGYDYPVHVSGETGTGKEMVALALHHESQRSEAPFVPINCGALPEGLIETELFGHVKGAFSGAIRNKKGRFELADKGTIFLDEVSELSKHIQVKLLRILQEGTLERVGDEKTISVDVRVISATNKNLKKEVEKNNFRDDLYYRLNVVPICLPPLRDRRNDIPLLVDHFLKKDIHRQTHKEYQISKEALAVMMAYHWPGNVRELLNAIQFAIVRCKGRTISPEHLPMELRHIQSPEYRRGPAKKLDRHRVKAALEKTGGNKVRAAGLLGVGRATLYRFIQDYPDVMEEHGGKPR